VEVLAEAGGKDGHMAGTKIQAAEHSVGRIFEDDYRFTIPLYQRPYSWTPDEAGELLTDLLAAAADADAAPAPDPYFLGSIVLVKEENQADAQVIDGQQRLTTLTILLSVLRDFVSDEFARSLRGRIFQADDPIKGVLGQPRLKIRQQDQLFFEKHIQQHEGLAKLGDVQTHVLPESQRLLVDNARMFQERLNTLSPEDCERLVRFIVLRTYLVTVATQDFDSAYRTFTVLNERGLDLTLTDILKAEIIGQIPKDEQETYTKIWEREEEDLGRGEFEELFSHLRMVHAKAKARQSILKGFRDDVLARFPDRRDFINEALVPYSDAYEVVINSDFKAPEGADEVNRLLSWLNRLDNFDWIAPAIRYLNVRAVSTPMIQTFLANLERLAASMFVRRVEVSKRIERYGRVLEAIEAEADLYAPGSPLQLSQTEMTETLHRLDADVYTVTKIRLYVLLRIDAALSAGGASYDYPIITVEHVLPQNPKPNSDWRRSFTDAQRQQWIHRLGNLVLLTRRKNAEAGNLDFEAKKRTYFQSKAGIVSFVLTTDVINHTSWTPTVLDARQARLLDTLAQLWRLK
jgi:uncharacterized protein with ParB-like and HNH nuclease domain